MQKRKTIPKKHEDRSQDCNLGFVFNVAKYARYVHVAPVWLLRNQLHQQYQSRRVLAYAINPRVRFCPLLSAYRSIALGRHIAKGTFG